MKMAFLATLPDHWWQEYNNGDFEELQMGIKNVSPIPKPDCRFYISYLPKNKNKKAFHQLNNNPYLAN